VTVPVGGLKGIISELRDALSPEGREYLENIPGRGYRFIERVEIIGPDGVRRWPWLIGLIMAIAAGGTIWLFWHRRVPPPSAIEIVSPLPGESVAYRHKVSGRVMAAGAPVCIVIHPHSTDGYHNQPNVNVSANEWNVDAYFGDVDKDMAHLFDIVAIAGCTQPAGQLMSWPAGDHSKMVTVRRR
jgi:hypothetical protein